MKQLLQGIRRFHSEEFPKRRNQFKELRDQQQPQALFVTCADSRVLPSLITQSQPGDLFICRNAGNMVPPYGELHGGVSATIEYATMALGIGHIIVCGHSDCGAIRGVLNPELVSDMPTVASWLRHADVAREVVKNNYQLDTIAEKLRALTEENVLAQINNLKTHPSVASRMAGGQVALYGMVYEIETAEIRAYDVEKETFVNLADLPEGSELPLAARVRRLAVGSTA